MNAPRRPILVLAPALALLLLAGCKKDESSILDRPVIKDCKRLYDVNDPEMVAYRKAAHKDCALANTLQQKMNSIGCEIRKTMRACGRLSKEIDAEEEAVLKEIGAK